MKNLPSTPETVSDKEQTQTCSSCSLANLNQSFFGSCFRRCYESETSIKLMSLKYFERLHLFLGHWFALCFCKGLQQELYQGNTESDGTASYDKYAQANSFFKGIDVMIIF